MKAFRLALIALACMISSAAFAARPAAPRITEWPSVPGTNRYELWIH